MTKIGFVLLFLVPVFLASCGTKDLRVQEFQVPADTPNPANPTGEFYVVGPGDVLGVTIWKDASLSGPVKVRPDGFITLPLINEVQVTGLTTAQVRKTLEEKYKKFLASPFVTIRVEQIQSSQVYVVGQVNSPGIYPFVGKDTLLQVLLQAGGLTIFAKKRNIRVVRREGDKITEYTVDYNAIIKGDFKQDILLRPGDRVIVP